MWFFKKIVDVCCFILFEWFEIFFVSGIFNGTVIILIYLLRKKYNIKNTDVVRVFVSVKLV